MIQQLVKWFVTEAYEQLLPMTNRVVVNDGLQVVHWKEWTKDQELSVVRPEVLYGEMLENAVEK
jgi:hypothetical protein